MSISTVLALRKGANPQRKSRLVKKLLFHQTVKERKDNANQKPTYPKARD
jgi:hypothetical protein